MADTNTIDEVNLNTRLEPDENKKKSTSKSKSKRLRILAVGQGEGAGFVVNGQKIEVYSVRPRRVSPDKRQVVLEGYRLDVYNKILLTPESDPSLEIEPDFLKLPADVKGKISFELPEKSLGVFKDKDSIWIKLLSVLEPQANAVVSHYLSFNEKEEEEDEGSKKSQKTQGNQSRKAQSSGSGGTIVDTIVNAASEAIGGVVGPFIPNSLQIDNARNNLKDILKNGSKEEKKRALEELKKLDDKEGLKSAFKDASVEDQRLISETMKDMGSNDVQVEISEDKTVPESISKKLNLQGDDEDADNDFENLTYERNNLNEADRINTKKLLDEYLKENSVLVNSESDRVAVLGAVENGNFTTLSPSQNLLLEISLKGAVSALTEEQEQLKINVENVFSAAGFGSKITSNIKVRSENASSNVTASLSETVNSESKVNASISGTGGTSASVTGNIGVDNVSTTLSNNASQTTFTPAKKQNASNIASNIASKISQSIQPNISEEIKEDPVYKKTRLEVEAKGQNQPSEGNNFSKEAGIHAQTLEVLLKSSPETVSQYQVGKEDEVFDDAGEDPMILNINEQINQQIKNVLNQTDLPKEEAQELENYLKQEVPKKVWQNFSKNYPKKAEKYRNVIPELNQAMEEFEIPNEEKKEKKEVEEERQANQISPELEAQIQAMRKQTIDPKEVSGEKKVSRLGIILPKGVKGSEPKGGFQGGRSVDASGMNGNLSKKGLSGSEKADDGNKPAQDTKSPEKAENTEIPKDGAKPSDKEEGKPDDKMPEKTPVVPSSSPIEQPKPPLSPVSEKKTPAEKESEKPTKNGQVEPSDKSDSNEAETSKNAAAETKKSEDLKNLTKPIIDKVNLALNAPLMELVGLSWGAIAASFGLLSLIIAPLWNLALLLKNSIIRRFLTPFLVTDELKKQADEIAKQIKFSSPVKVNIGLFNLVAVIVFGLVMLFFVIVIKAMCNNWITYGTIWLSGQSKICEDINFAPGNTFSDYLNTPSSNQSLSLIGTAQWDSQILSVSRDAGIDACAVKVVVQKESAGNPKIIGCDCAKNGQPQACLEKDPSDHTPNFRFNWTQCSYGIGLTQWTIFQNRFASVPNDFRRWRDPSTPSRTPDNRNFYTVEDFLNPQTSLRLTAQTLAGAYNRSQAPDPRGKIRDAFMAYVGRSNIQDQLVNQRMLLYDICKNSASQ